MDAGGKRSATGSISRTALRAFVALIALALPASVARSQPVPTAVVSAATAIDPQASQTLKNRAGLALADPILDGDATFTAQRIATWQAPDGARMMLLDGTGVSVTVGFYGFAADRAVIRIDSETRPGRVVRHLTMYLDNARPRQAQGSTQAQASRLLVTASTTGKVEIETDLLSRDDASADPLVVDADGRFERYAKSLASTPLSLPPAAIRDEPKRPADPEPVLVTRPGGGLIGLPRATGDREDVSPARPTPGDELPPTTIGDADPSPRAVTQRTLNRVLPAKGVISFNADEPIFDAGDPNEYKVILIGDIRVMYHGTGDGRSLSLQAENAVIFVDPNVAGAGASSFDAGAVRGIYLEDNVIISDGDYTVRAPRVFYDVETDRAIVLDAVLYTWDVRREVPLYIRAEKLMQESKTSWRAERALLTTSEFAEPHFAIASRAITFREERQAGSPPRYFYTAKDTTLDVGGTPVFGWPTLSGEAQDVPLRRVDVAYNSDDGLDTRTRWDLFGLTGSRAPDGVDLTGDIDYRGEHGPALGADLSYVRPDMRGLLDSYILLFDNGEDEIADRRDVTFDDDARGYIRWQHRQQLRKDWELSLEAAYVSQETMLEELFPDKAANEKQYESSIYLKKQQDDLAFTFLTKYDLSEFTTQTPTLQSRGYTVDKVPELGVYNVGASVFDNSLTYYGTHRASRMRIHGGEDRPTERGFTNGQSIRFFGIPNVTSFEDALSAAGVPGNYRNRFDSRNELQAPMKLGTIDFVPYVMGQVTAYDDDFFEFSGNDDRYRFYGGAGMRLHTQFHRVYNGVDNRLLDLHRLRHTIEPHVDAFLGASTIDPGDLPIYDDDVEGINEGLTLRLGLRNTFQTQRGGPGRWRSVDWLTINADFVHRSDDANITPIARFFAYRPEYTRGGEHFHTNIMWMVTDALSLAADITYDMQRDFVPQWRLGASIDLTPRLDAFTNYSRIADLRSDLFSYGFTYQLTTKYTLGFEHVIDIANSDNRSFDVTLARQLPRWKLIFLGRIDEIDGDETIGVVLIPEGIGGSRYRGVGSRFYSQ